MSYESSPIHDNGLHPTPKLIESFKPDVEEEICMEVLSVEEPPVFQSLKSRVEQFPSSCLDFMKDAKWMSLIVSIFTIASQSCSLIAESAGLAVPILNIASSPFLLHTTIKGCLMRFRLVESAAKTSRVVEALFWSGRGIGSIGMAISNLIKPFVGGLRISGIHSLPGAALTFTVIFPILLICLSTIGGASEGWSMVRNAKVFREFKLQRVEVDEDLENLDQLLTFLLGPQESAFADKELEHELELRFFKDTHFTNDSRREVIQERIRSLLGHRDLHKIQSAQERLVGEEMKDLIEMTKGASDLYQNLLDPNRSYFQNIETALCLYEQLIQAHGKLNLEEEPIQNLVAEMKEGFNELTDLKNLLLQEGGSILELSESEIHRILMQNAVTILIATLSLIAGVLFLLPGSCPLVASALAITSASFTIINVLFDKSISQERFLALERFFCSKVVHTPS